MPKFDLSEEKLRSLEAVCANRWPAVKRILGDPVKDKPKSKSKSKANDA